MGERDIREVLGQELSATAAWRREAAADHPEQHSHATSASALERLRDYIRDLPADDPRLAVIAKLNRDPDFFLIGGEDTRDLIDRYGVESAQGQNASEAGDAFLDRLIAAATADDAAAGGQAPPEG
jgi:hypothetical protein